jgi:hypothetical protein
MITDLANRALNAVTRVMGEPVIVRHRGESATVSGVYQDAYVGLDPETGVQVRSTQPVVLLNREGLPFRLQQGDELEARGVVFKVRDAQPDGHDGVLVMLHRTSNR